VWRGILIDGHNRFEIATRIGKPFHVVEKDFATRDQAVLWVVYNQFGRRNLTTAARAELAMRIEPILAEQAKARQVAAGEQFGRGQEKLVLKSEQPIARDINATKTATQAAEAAGLKRDTYHKAKTVLTTAPAPIVEAFRSGELSTNQAYQQVRREQKEAARESRREENARTIATVADAHTLVETGAAKFATLVIDPPWDWGDEGDDDQLGRARPTYSTMSFDELMALRVAEIADVDAHVYLWITNRSLPKGFALLQQWGFRYVTCLTWVKPSFGMGNYFRGQTEHVLFGVRGSQPLKRRDVGTVFSAPRGPNGHSSKPVAFYDLVESCSPGPYVELFSRQQREGWTMWGEVSRAA
jgi:N6-adenosine-specific RNA methylase IME4